MKLINVQVKAVVVALILSCTWCTHSEAFVGVEVFPILGMDFLMNGPGAKASGMGRSFVSTANDPTSMIWNPAGMAFLKGINISLQVAYLNATYTRPLSGAYVVDITGGGVWDTDRQDADMSEVSPSFLGVTYEWLEGTFGAYYFRPMDWTSSFKVRTTEPISNSLFVENARLSGTAVLDEFGFSYARDVTTRFLAGATLGYRMFDYESQWVPESPDYEPVPNKNKTGDLVVNLGLQYLITGRLMAGFVARKGTTHEVANDLDQKLVGADVKARDMDVSSPTSLTVGFSYYPITKLNVSVDVGYMLYSVIGSGNFKINLRDDNYDYKQHWSSPDDGIEFHLGAEYFHSFASLNAGLFLRAGAYSIANHFPKYTYDERNLDSGTDREQMKIKRRMALLAELYPGGGSATVVTAGAGGYFRPLVDSSLSFKFDLGIEISDDFTIASVGIGTRL